MSNMGPDGKPKGRTGGIQRPSVVFVDLGRDGVTRARRLLSDAPEARGLLDCVRDEVVSRLSWDAVLSEVCQLIDRAPGLGADARVALAVFAWSCRAISGAALERTRRVVERDLDVVA